MYFKLFYSFFMCFMMATTGCSQKQQALPGDSGKQADKIKTPEFNADTAYMYVQKQVDFGPRVPNTSAHVACGDYFSAEFKRLGTEVVEQKAELRNYKGTILKARNIIASFQPENKNRILLFAHWDTRPYADRDPDPAKQHIPIDGANDGASGCGVLLEIARQLHMQPSSIGVDLILFDAEDWGAPAFEKESYSDSGYCLGSEYWSQHPHVPGYTARYGILLDMVGAPDAVFYYELISKQYASGIVRKVWETAQASGYNKYFISKDGGGIEDDHVHVIKNRKIPCIDIIHYDPDMNGFASYWHTRDDSMENISKETLKAVGQTLLQVIYNEK